MGKKALVIIDMQNDLCLDLRRHHLVKEVIAPLNRLIDRFVETGQSVFYPCFALPKDDTQFKRFGDRYCIAGTSGAEVIAELLPLKGTVVEKRKHSAFFETDLDNLLKDASVSDVFLAGLQTQVCIMTTAADASFRGYRAVAVSDCVVSTRAERKQQALEWIERYVGEVLNSEQVALELSNG